MGKVFATNMSGKGFTSAVLKQIEKKRFGGVKT